MIRQTPSTHKLCPRSLKLSRCVGCVGRGAWSYQNDIDIFEILVKNCSKYVSASTICWNFFKVGTPSWDTYMQFSRNIFQVTKSSGGLVLKNSSWEVLKCRTCRLRLPYNLIWSHTTSIFNFSRENKFMRFRKNTQTSWVWKRS